MRNALAAFAAVAVLMLLSTPATADWKPNNPDDPKNSTNHKMHWPQMPDPDGWDVNCVFPNRVADDFLCTESGPLSDIHLWFSLERDDPDAQVLDSVEWVYVAIRADDPDPDGPGPEYSKPADGDPLWEHRFFPDQGDIDTPVVYSEEGDQGWADPVKNIWRRPDHKTIYQANITRIPKPFIQQGSPDDPITYWLELQVKMFDNSTTDLGLGWKTALPRYDWQDDAVYWDDTTPGFTPGWQELLEWGEGRSMNMAFVITPEPGTVVMLVIAGLMGLLAYARRRRKQ